MLIKITYKFKKSILFFITAILVNHTFASPYPDAGSLYREFKDHSFKKPAQPALPELKQVVPDGIYDDSIKTYVQHFELHGNTRLSEQQITAVLSEFVDKQLSNKDIHTAANSLMKRYHDEGLFLARVYVPPQAIINGRVQLYVYEGILEDGGVSISNSGERVKDEVVQKILITNLETNAVLETSDIERSILLVNDIPGINSHSTIYPGEEVGTAHFLLQTDDTPLVSGNIDVDNFGSYYTGENRIGTTIYIDSPTQQGDQITLRLVTSGSSSNYGFASYSVPIAGNGLRLGLSIDYLDYELEKAFESLGAEGDVSEIRAFSTYPFIRSRHLNLIGRVDLSQLKLDDHNDMGLLAERTIESGIFSLSGDHDDDLLANGTSYFSASLTAGSLDIEGNDAFKAFDQQNTNSEGSFQKLALSFSRLQHLTGNLSTYLSLSGQLASDNLDSSQKFFIGGPFSVPGYPTGEVSGDEGLLAHVDLRYDFYDLPWGGSFQASTFYSWGEVKLFKDTWPGWEAGNPIIQNRITLESFGIAINQSWPEGFVVRGMIGWQVGDNDGRNPITDKDSDNSNSNSRAWLQGIYYF